MSRSLMARLARRFEPRRDGISRREFLKTAAAASAALPFSGCAGLFRGRESKPGGPRVVIVGAGLAGLACGFELSIAGYDVTVYEARRRVGGRVVSLADLAPSRNVEGGGEFIGSNHPTWLAYAGRFKLDLLEITEDPSLEMPVILGGERLSADEMRALWMELSLACARMTADAAAIDANEPWTSPQAADLDRRTTAHWIASQELSPRCRQALSVMLTANNGVAPEAQSYLANLAAVKGGGLERYWTETEVYRCRGGNQALASKLAEAIGWSRVKLQTPVTAITLRPDGETVAVTDAVGHVIDAQDVVLATPPSTWRRIAFRPKLPATLAPQMGSNVKYLAVLEDRFWKASRLSPDSFTDGDVSMTWEATDGQPGDEGAVLTAFSGGPQAEACRRRGGEEREAAYRSELEWIYPGFRAKLRGSRFMDWPADPWTGGSYSFPAPGEITTIGPVLRRGVGRLHFAGEHASYAFVGYMEGALESGVAAAVRIAARDGVRVN